jgi:endopolyphosphatase
MVVSLFSECDTPPALVDYTFNWLENWKHDVDFVIVTGDNAR